MKKKNNTRLFKPYQQITLLYVIPMLFISQKTENNYNINK